MEPETHQSTSNGGGEDNNGGFFASCLERVCSAVDEARSSVLGFAGKLAKIARDDPRRVAHAFKVGLALNLVSIVYYVSPLFNGFGDSAIWAVLTVVFVMEFTVGTYATSTVISI
jgi:hypothetical protein